LVDVDVWVIDGRPNYHTAHCGVLLGAEPETIPHSQAVEDGFTPCTLCDPDAHPERAAATGAAQQPPAAADVAEPGDLRQVWVVDGWPYYHAQGCNRLVGAEPEPIPFGQAVEDGFTACPTCQPAVIEPAPAEPAPVEATASELTTSELTTSEPTTSEVMPPEPVTPEPIAEAVVAEPAVAEPEPVATPDPEPAAEVPVAEPEPAVVEPEPEPAAAEAEATDARADVWVVPGRPRFHVQGCMIIGDQDAIAVPYTQAIDDGFKPCSLCEPV
jgi:hypothetical protein